MAWLFVRKEPRHVQKYEAFLRDLEIEATAEAAAQRRSRSDPQGGPARQSPVSARKGASKIFNAQKTLADFDPTPWHAIEAEGHRQEDQIASEDHVSPCVLQAQGSVPTNKYAEGYFGKRYTAVA